MITYGEGIGCVTMNSIAKVKLLVSQECFIFAFFLAVPAAAIGCVVKILDTEYSLLTYILPEKDMYNIFTTLVGFVTIFHTSQSYSRYMSGITLVLQMMSDYTDVMSLLTAFTQTSTAEPTKVRRFLDSSARLLSLLFVYSLADLEQSEIMTEREGDLEEIESRLAFDYEVLDVRGFDRDTLLRIIRSPCKVETINQLLQSQIGEHISNGVLAAPPPLMTRVYHSLGDGAFRFHEALKFRYAPFPFPYAAVTDMLMLLHWCATPFMIASWTTGATTCAVCTFIQTFAIWSLNGIAGTLDNPFGTDRTDMDGEALAREFNMKIKTLIEAGTTATLKFSTDGAEDLKTSQITTISEVVGQFCEEGVVQKKCEEEEAEASTIPCTCCPGKICQRDKTIHESRSSRRSRLQKVIAGKLGRGPCQPKRVISTRNQIYSTSDKSPPSRLKTHGEVPNSLSTDEDTLELEARVQTREKYRKGASQMTSALSTHPQQNDTGVVQQATDPKGSMV